jgi:hypothetical protein
MSSSIETGHAKNVANFEKLITNITGFGRQYNPSKESIKLSALNALLASAKNSIVQVNSTEPAYKNAVSAREAAFAPLAKLITRVNNSLKASNSSSQVDDSAMTLVRKLQGRRATPKLADDEKNAAATEAEGKEVNQISSSQMSYDSRLDNFDKLIKLLASEPEYAPNEADLKIDSLTTYYNDLNTKNTAVINATVPLNTARISRNIVLYTPLSGVVDISVDVKTYVKSVFGATSPQYKAISGLTFTSAK